MANVKITDLSAASTPLAGTEELELVQSGTSVKVTAQDVADSYSIPVPVASGGTGAVTLTGYVKAAGTAAMTAASTVPFNDIANWAYAAFCDVTDQSGNTGVGTSVKFATTSIAGAGITVAVDGSGNYTRITFAAAGTYAINFTLRFANSDAADQDATIWLVKNGTNITNSGHKVTVPKTGDGGRLSFATTHYESVTAGQYVEIVWLPENVSVTLDSVSAAAGPPAVPAIPASDVSCQRVA